jgi:hypothetical protein
MTKNKYGSSWIDYNDRVRVKATNKKGIAVRLLTKDDSGKLVDKIAVDLEQIYDRYKVYDREELEICNNG